MKRTVEESETHSQDAVRGEGVVVAYGRDTALAASDFRVPEGSVTSLIGPNGSGKSTLLHAVAGLVEPGRGRITVLGRPPAEVHHRVALVFQSAKVNEAMPVTVGEAVTMGRFARRGPFGRLHRADRAAVERAMERLGILELRHRHLRELSGGERQRVFVAQGLAQEADLLMLDEPLTGLDIPSHERIDAVIEEEHRAGRTVMITTHDIAEARRCEHVMLLAGHVVAEGPPGDVLSPERLAEAYGAQLLHVEEHAPLVDDAGHLPADDRLR